jgi:protein TonB
MEVANATADSDGDVFNVVEVMPRFPGCEDLAEEGRSQCAQGKLLQYVYDNIQYPEAAKKLNVEGMVVVSFIVDESGRINDPTIVRNIGAGTGEEVIRVVNKMNEDNIRWIPGEQRGRKVKVKFHLPVKFALD